MLVNTFPGAKKTHWCCVSFVSPVLLRSSLFCLVTKIPTKNAKMPRFSFSNKKAARSDCSKRTCLVDILFGNSMMGALPFCWQLGSLSTVGWVFGGCPRSTLKHTTKDFVQKMAGRHWRKGVYLKESCTTKIGFAFCCCKLWISCDATHVFFHNAQQTNNFMELDDGMWPPYEGL